MSAGSSHYINVRDYEKWSERKIRRRYRLARALYRRLGIHDELLSVERVKRIYTFSNWAREIYIEHGVHRDKVDVIYPGFDVPDLSDCKAEQQIIKFLFIGREFIRKGGALVLDAFRRLRETNNNVSLTIVTRDIDRVPPGPSIRVLPFMNRAKLYKEVYPAADVFVMPTEAEGWGFTNAEAMSFALPVISSRISAIPEIVGDGLSGLLIEPGDLCGLTAAMRRLADSRDLREEMGRLGRERFVAKFSRDVFRDNLREFYVAAMRK
jgi:glycosyltransferase involved in cell wall biosynthesis